jgi:uncharacterized protein (TIGR01777 family)
MNVIVAGGTGFIGSALVRALKARGDQVAVLARNPEDVRRLFGEGVDALEWHPPQSGPWISAFSNADAVVNMAGRPVIDPFRPWTTEEKARIRDSRIGPTRALVEALRQVDPRPRVLVNQSAIGYYGSQGDTVLTEQSPPGSDFLATLVQEWEAVARPAEDLGVRVVLPRTGIVLGHGGLLSQLALPFKLYGGGVMGKPDQWISWIHLDDEVDLIIHALSHEHIHGPINATAPNPVTMDVLSNDIGQALNRPVWVPLLWLPIKLLLGQRAQAMLASQRVLPEVAKNSGYMFRHAQSGEAIRSLLAPRPTGGSL